MRVGTNLTFYTRTKETWDSMYEDCEKAQTSITFEQYMLIGDETGNRFLKLFIAKARAGVSVHLLLDAVGSHKIRGSALLHELEEAGGKVRFYNPLKIWHIFHPSRWLPRDHCKTMMIDSKIAYTGGVCIADFMRSWHDLHVRITGDLVEHMQSGQSLNPDRGIDEARGDTDLYRYVGKFSKFRPNPIYRELIKNINKAEYEVCMVTPYFFPPGRLRKAMKKAVRRGVRVRVIVSEKTDIPLASFFSRTYFRRLMQKGVEVLVYDEATLHAKYAIVDEKWTTMGSTNWDYLSLFYNREANLIIKEKAVIAKMKAIFENNAQVCKTADHRVPLWVKIFWPIIRRLRKVF